MHTGSWKLHAAFSFKIAIIYFFHQAIILKKQKHQSNAFLTRIRNIYFILIESKKRSHYDQKKVNSYKAIKFEHAHLHVFHCGVFPTPIPATWNKIHIFVRFKFWKQIWNQNKIMNRTVPFKFSFVLFKIKHLYYSCWALL